MRRLRSTIYGRTRLENGIIGRRKRDAAFSFDAQLIGFAAGELTKTEFSGNVRQEIRSTVETSFFLLRTSLAFLRVREASSILLQNATK